MRAILAMGCFCFLLLGFSNTENFKKKKKAPPGTVRLNDTLFIDGTEVANVGWREFTQGWLLGIKKDTSLYEEMMQDTLLLDSFYTHTPVPFSFFYHRHPAYNNYPVIGVTYEQATAFCKWRSDRVNELYEKNPKLNPFPNKKYRYRLPTTIEWELAASGQLNVDSFPFGAKSQWVKYRGKQAYASNCIYDSLRKSYPMELTATVDLYYPNGYGCYNLIGNVLEMVSEKGIAKGGNFLLPLDSCKIKLEQHYTKPEAWLGFRCVCEIVN